MKEPLQAGFLVIAGAAGALVGTAGGITSLISYPALLATGLPPVSANMANLVAVVVCWPGTALVSRRELSGQRAWVTRWVLLSAVGVAGGALLLLTTGQGAFVRVVPLLVLASGVALAVQPRFRRVGVSIPRRRTRVLGAAGLLAISVYNGYFGAGSGVITLALLMLTTDLALVTANALKNMLVGGAAVVTAAIFISVGRVSWSAVIPLGVGMFAGSLLGPRVTRRAREGVVRWVAAGLAVALAVELWVNPTL